MRKSAELRKAEIVATVLEMADRIGPDRVTTAAVAQQIGVTQAALFRHFPSKAELWAAVAEQVTDTLATAWRTALEDVSDPLERVRALVAAQLAVIARTPAIPMLLFSRELTIENDLLRGAFQERLGAFHEMLAADLAAAQTQGRIPADLAPRDVAYLLSSLVQGAAIRWALGARKTSMEETGLALLDVQLRLLQRQEGSRRDA
ncbi:TetR family transcriptional regulator [Thioclava sp. GXIMD4215]|uniref:TetR family transcriptional regulator n=1 Tax=Thioclava sp. GXIMD4215 TaxID=3131928 RepID=UPI00311AE29F